MSLFCTAVILFFAIHALRSLGKSSTPGVDHVTGRKPGRLPLDVLPYVLPFSQTRSEGGFDLHEFSF
ncbi:uncharacterized protein Bfra_007967 [Botrytis fragariae]|uniref:Secreted protein n=1 Tax=Botrytis fragariae TaxID=1964551 RepID=A0A8H6APV2_9HELO|nr:uncharacterized protein Bfra_007967 [Botrytis fragariae]KAF5871449.1 hypothetical protein Bfra_007967 [Botrytis fragariae]